MRITKENRRHREAAGDEGSGTFRICRTGRRNRGRAGARAAARIVRDGIAGQWQCGRVHGDAGSPRQQCRNPVILVARGDRKAGFFACARIGRDRDRSGPAGIGRAAGSGRAVARGGRCNSLHLCRRGSGRSAAQPARARPDREPAFGTGGRDIGCHHPAASYRGGTRPQCRPDPLERSRCTFCRAGGGCTRRPCLHRRIVAAARPPRWRMLAAGMGS